MYIGTTSQMGLNVLVREIWDNSIDEYTAGFGDTIDIEIFKNGRVKVIDHGRGIPVGPHPEWKKPDGTPLDTLTGILTILHAGGKFGEEGSAYKSAAGLHGVGSKCANALSKEFIATVKRDGKIYQQKFKYGDPVTDVEVIGSCDINDTGTTIEYEPDPNIFKQTVLPNCNALQNKIDEVTSLNGGLTIKYKNNNTNVEKVFHHPDGINSYVKTIIGEKKKLFEEPFYYSEMVKVDNKCINVEFSFIYDDEDKPAEVFKTFANNVNTTEGGYHLMGFRDSYKKCMNDFIIKNNLSKTDVELRYLLDGIYCIISVRVPEAEFEGQTKNKLGNIEAKAAVVIAVEKMFEKLSDSRSEDIKLIADRAIKVKIAEEAARKARQNARAANKASKMALPGKLIDCSNKTGYRELFLVEGDSAGGSAKMGRFHKFQAILPLRGKVLNVEKVDISRVLNSDSIKGIISAIGTGIGTNFNIKKARYDKILIMSDADVDGSHIRILLLTFFYNYMRPLIEAGMVYSTQPPLFKVILKDKSFIYLKDDEALAIYKKKNGKKIDDIQRFKGLGEMDPPELRETVLSLENRTVKQITIQDAKEASETFKLFMSKDVAPRRQFIEEHAHLVDLTLL